MEGKEASLCLKSENDCAVFAYRKDCFRALHHYTLSNASENLFMGLEVLDHSPYSKDCNLCSYH